MSKLVGTGGWVPRLRFPEFRGAGACVAVPLSPWVLVPTLRRGNRGPGRSSGLFAPLERRRLHSHAGAWERSWGEGL
jgi:hypothetical protein